MTRTHHDLRLGVIGVGGRGNLARHANRPGEGARLVAGADPAPEALETFEHAYSGAQTYDDYTTMLDEVDLDAVFVTTPDFLHEDHAVAALNRGLGVYLEKPMAITLAGCDAILEAAARNEAKLYVGHNMRHMRFIQTMKRLIDEGRIGQVKAAWCRHFIAYGGDAYFKDWHSERRYANSLLLQKAAHDIDVMHWLCSGYTRRVVAMGALSLYNLVTDRREADAPPDVGWSNDNWPPLSQKGFSPTIDVEDINHLLAEFDNGVLATYQQCHYTPDAWRNYTVIGTEGRLENVGGEGGDSEIRLWTHRGGFSERGNEQIPSSAGEGGHGGADPAIVEEFLDYVRHAGPTTTTPLAARWAVAAGALAADSLRDGSTPRDVPPPPAWVENYFSDSAVG